MSQIPTARYENVPNSNQLGRKRPRFRSARTKTSQIPISKDENVPDSDEICLVLMRSSAIFRKICEKLRLGRKYAEWIIMRNCVENRKLCDIALTALKCCLCFIGWFDTALHGLFQIRNNCSRVLALEGE